MQRARDLVEPTTYERLVRCAVCENAAINYAVELDDDRCEIVNVPPSNAFKSTARQVAKRMQLPCFLTDRQITCIYACLAKTSHSQSTSTARRAALIDAWKSAFNTPPTERTVQSFVRAKNKLAMPLEAWCTVASGLPLSISSDDIDAQKIAKTLVSVAPTLSKEAIENLASYVVVQRSMGIATNDCLNFLHASFMSTTLKLTQRAAFRAIAAVVDAVPVNISKATEKMMQASILLDTLDHN